MKSRPSKLDPLTTSLDEWFGVQNLTLAEVQKKLAEDGCKTSLDSLSRWWQSRQLELSEEQLLAQITSGAALHQKVKAQFSQDAPPELQTLIDLHRVLIMQLSSQAVTNPKMLELADRSMRTVMEFHSGVTKAGHKERELKVIETRLRMESDEFMEKVLVRAAELNQSTLSNAEKIKAMRQTFFADVEALAASGKVRIPKA